MGSSSWQTKLIDMLLKAEENGGAINPRLFSLSNGRGGYVDGRAVRLFLDKLVGAGTVARENGWYRAI